MKKLFLLCFLFVSFSVAFWIEFDLKTSLYLDENEWIVSLWVVDILLQSGTNLSEFDLNIWKNDYMIFDDDFSKITINNTTWFDVSLDETYKTLSFVWLFSWDLEIWWIYIRTYDEKIDDAKLWLNWTWDVSIDEYTIRKIDLDENWTNSDSMKPLPITNWSYSIDWKTISLSWAKSPDLDITKNLVRVYRNGYFFNDISLSPIDATYILTDIDLDEYTWKIELYSKDVYYLSVPFALYLEKDETADENTEETKDDDEIVCASVIQPATNDETWECKEFSTPCSVSVWWTPVDACEVIKLEIVAVEIEIIDYQTKWFISFQTKFDKIIENKIKDFDLEKQNSVISVRNEIVNLLKSYEDETISKKDTISKLIWLILDYKNAIK